MSIIQTAIVWLQEYFSGVSEAPSKTPTLCDAAMSGGTFMREVWLKAMEIPFGETVSYGQLSAMAGRPLAARAVGQAMRTNPFVLLVPCHRVVRADGHLGHYNAGKSDAVKQWLNRFESAKHC